MAGTDLTRHPVHLGLGATAQTEPEFTGSMDWYADYLDRHEEDGAEGRLVSMYVFADSWDIWEMHPEGSELVVCTAGVITRHQESPDGSRTTVTLGPGEYAINEPGTWHTADVEDEAAALFITAGRGTQHRQR